MFIGQTTFLFPDEHKMLMLIILFKWTKNSIYGNFTPGYGKYLVGHIIIYFVEYESCQKWLTTT